MDEDVFNLFSSQSPEWGGVCCTPRATMELAESAEAAGAGGGGRGAGRGNICLIRTFSNNSIFTPFE